MMRISWKEACLLPKTASGRLSEGFACDFGFAESGLYRSLQLHRSR